MARIFVVGLMRSGKSTVAEALSRSDDVAVVEEPDNPLSRPFGLRVARLLGRRYFPSLAVGEQAPEYESLWRHAFGEGSGGARPFSFRERVQRMLARGLLLGASGDGVLGAVSGAGTRGATVRLRAAAALAVPERPTRAAAHVLVAANAPLAAEWVADRLAASVIVVLRDPADLLSSWAQLDWLGGPGHDMLDELDPRFAATGAAAVGIPIPGRDRSPLVRAAWLAGLLTFRLREAAARNASWHVVRFKRLAEDIREVALGLGLPGAAAGPLGRSPEGDEPGALRPLPEPAELAEALALLAGFPPGPSPAS